MLNTQIKKINIINTLYIYNNDISNYLLLHIYYIISDNQIDDKK